VSNLSRYRKAIVAVVGAALTVIPVAFPGASWAAPVIAGLTALAVYLVPNVTPVPAVTFSMAPVPPVSVARPPAGTLADAPPVITPAVKP